MRIALIGNSGSGKSSLARWFARQGAVAMLDLDTVAWQSGEAAVARDPEAAAADVRTFCEANADWVVEGCYTHLIRQALRFEPLLVFLNPGEAQCIANCLARPWEPHKFGSRRAQDERLEFLLSWVRGYYSRDDDLSLAAHRVCFDSYDGRKVELDTRPCFEPLDPALAASLG